MRRLLIGITLFCFTSHQILAVAQTPAQEGAAAAAAANIAIQGFISTQSAAAVVPSYTATPPQSLYYGQPDLSSPATARISACTGATDPACQAATTAIQSALAPRPAIGAHDAAVAGVRAIADNPTAVLSDLSAYYGGCTTTNVTSPPRLESKICNRYAALGNIRCSSKRIGEITSVPSCAAGTWVPVGTAARNGADVMQVEAFCDPARTDGRQAFRFYAHGGEGACIGWQGVELPTAGVPNFQVLASLSPHWEGSCWRSFYVAVAPSAGCAGGTCNYTFKFGRPTLDGSGAITDVGPWSVTSSFDPPRGITSVADTWDNQCAILEANSGFGACTKVSGPACVDGPSTKTIQGQEVAAPCWEFQSTYRCNDAPAADECAPLAAQGCVRSASTCAQALPGDPLTCGIFQDTYQCSKAAQTTTTVSRCGPERSSPDADFARTVAFLEAGREAGRYLDPASLRVFKGADNRCDKKLFGITNCCKGGGTDAASLFNNASMASTATTAYQSAFSTYTYDALFVSDAPGWVLSAFESLSGASTGFSSALAGVAAGDVSFMSFLSSISAFTWVAIVIFMIQASGILDCPENAQVTAMKRDAHLCADIGEYCSSTLPVIGTCVTRTHTYCCFNSRLSRLINEQGRAQLGVPWGSAEHPRCDGFTIAELQRLNFAAMDLSEFYAEIVPTLPNVPGTIAAQQGRMPQCYFGQGRC